ncbi:MAG: S8 family serine peptidase, partial [candidate division KSB1 bacterium]|nr:S8 family serine peptidase [candidate division KSB1 bacterium]
VVVVNSNGNEGTSLWRHMMAPADGFHVISVGAVYNTGELVGFSSRGPTYDGRIKPDVVAMGANVISAQPNTLSDYRGVSGTSLSSPLVAGVAALILQAHPYLTPFEVRDALRETADRAQNPDNDYGWGLVNAYEAIFYHGLFFSSKPKIFANEQTGHLIKIQIFSKANLKTDALYLYYSILDQPFTPIPLEPTQEPQEYQAWIPFAPFGTEVKFYFSAANESGDFKYHPHRAPEEYFSFIAFDSSITRIEPPQHFRLHQNYPNPFASTTTIRYDLHAPAPVTLIIYNLRGQQVRKLVDEFLHPFYYQKEWDGRDDQGRLVSSGIYFVRLRAGAFSAMKRMVLLREIKK